jgi:tetratricopeptide (TPR) repeat protein
MRRVTELRSLLGIVLCLILCVSVAVGQDLAQQKQQKLNQVNEIDAKIKAGASGAEYDELIKQREKLVAEIKDIDSKLMADTEAMKRINAVKKAFNDGNNAYKLGQNQQALDSYNAAISLDSTFFKAHYGKGLTLKRLRRYEEAVVAYQAAIRHSSTYTDAYVALGKIYNETGKPDMAIQTYQKAVQNDPSASKAYYELGAVYLDAKKDHNRAAENFMRATQLDTEYDLAFYSLGVALTELGRLDDAELALENAISVSDRKKWAEPHYRLAVLHNKKGAFADAKDSAAEALKHKPGYAPAAYEAGRAAKSLGQTTEAITFFELASRDRAWKQTADYEIDAIKNKDKYGSNN